MKKPKNPKNTQVTTTAGLRQPIAELSDEQLRQVVGGAAQQPQVATVQPAVSNQTLIGFETGDLTRPMIIGGL